MNKSGRICIFGAGTVGCYIGGRLIAAGANVRLVGRASQAQQLQSSGLTLTDLRGVRRKVRATRIDFVIEDPHAALDAELILITFKSAATESAARALSDVLKPGSALISLQNGLGNAATLQRLLPQCTVLAGMVPFNVLSRGEGTFHQGSDGCLMVQNHPVLEGYLTQFEMAGLPIERRGDMQAVQRAKLILNLNNAINALCGLPLKSELSQRSYRRCLAAVQREALRLFDASDQPLARLTPIPPHWLPRILELPDFIFKRAANRMLAIDPLARSSMWEDLEAGRTTEAEWLNGEIIRLAARIGCDAPVNQRVMDLIRIAEQGGRRDWSGDALLAELRRTKQ